MPSPDPEINRRWEEEKSKVLSWAIATQRKGDAMTANEEPVSAEAVAYRIEKGLPEAISNVTHGVAQDLGLVRDEEERIILPNGTLVDVYYEIGDPRDQELALSFTPGAIRSHFDVDDDDVAQAVRDASDEELRRVGESCLAADTLYREFHYLLTEGVKTEVMGEETP